MTRSSGCAVSQSFNHLLSCVLCTCKHGIAPNLQQCWTDRASSGLGAKAMVGRRGGKEGKVGGWGLQGALPSLAMLTLGCASTLATNEIDPGAQAHTGVPPRSGLGPCKNQTEAKYLSSCTQRALSLLSKREIDFLQHHRSQHTSYRWGAAFYSLWIDL